MALRVRVAVRVAVGGEAEAVAVVGAEGAERVEVGLAHFCALPNVGGCNS